VKFVGVDLHKQTITFAIRDAAPSATSRDTAAPRVGLCGAGAPRTRKRAPDLVRRRFSNQQTAEMVACLSALGEFQITVEATASYEWFVRLVEPLAQRVVLAHPGKLRIIAESTRKSDNLDARVLADMLALDQIPPAYRPTPRQRAHRRLVRHRAYLQRRSTSVRNKIRHILADSNRDRPDLFTAVGREYLASLPLDAEERFVVNQLAREWEFYQAQLRDWEKRMREFILAGSPQEQADRARLHSIPGVGAVTCEVLLAELADARRFGSAKEAVAYAGLAPGQRESAGKRKNLSIEKTGSPLLRWVLVQAAWQLAQRSPRWREIFEHLAQRVGRKRAIVAVARRLLGLAHALIVKEQLYQEITAGDLRRLHTQHIEESARRGRRKAGAMS
jgi:transposase